MRKEPVRVRVIASQPAPGQDGIDRLIGKVYKGTILKGEDNKPTGEVSVIDDVIFRGVIILNPGEYETI